MGLFSHRKPKEGAPDNNRVFINGEARNMYVYDNVPLKYIKNWVRFTVDVIPKK